MPNVIVRADNQKMYSPETATQQSQPGLNTYSHYLDGMNKINQNHSATSSATSLSYTRQGQSAMPESFNGPPGDDAFLYLNESRYASSASTPQGSFAPPPHEAYLGNLFPASGSSNVHEAMHPSPGNGEASSHISYHDYPSQSLLGSSNARSYSNGPPPPQLQHNTFTNSSSFPVQLPHAFSGQNAPARPPVYNNSTLPGNYVPDLFYSSYETPRYGNQPSHFAQQPLGHPLGNPFQYVTAAHGLSTFGQPGLPSATSSNGRNSHEDLLSGNRIAGSQQAYEGQPNPSTYQPSSSSTISPPGIKEEGSETKPKKLKRNKDGTLIPIEPPIKNACLSCRTKKARCDGIQPVCGQCLGKGRECVYVKSRRGGARKRKEDLPALPSALQTFLQQLDALQAPMGEPPLQMDDLSLGGGSTSAVDAALAVRTFASNDVNGIIACYYDEIHPFQPVLPPIKHKLWVIDHLTYASPFLIAIRAIISLSPNPADPQPKSLSSRGLRRSHASRLAKEASDRVDELLTLGEAADNKDHLIECVQALSLLGLYEFAQTGNAVKNKFRMNQAVEVAMELGLHQADKATFGKSTKKVGRDARPIPVTHVEGKDPWKDMQRRTWWVVFAGMLISGLVAGSRPIVAYDDRRIMVNYPATVVGDDSWGIWIESIGLACQAMDIIMTLDYDSPNPNPTTPPSEEFISDDEMMGMNPVERKAAREKKVLHRRMVALDKSVLTLLKKGESMAMIPLVPGGEEEVVRNQQLSASMMLAVCHIQLHRRQAFPEVALFSRKMCGLPKAAVDVESVATPEQTFSIYDNSRTEGQDVFDDQASSIYGSQYPGSVSGSISSQQIRHLSAGASTASDPLMANDALLTGATLPLSHEALDAMNSMNTTMDGLLWDSAIYPSNLPMPWFEQPRQAADLYQRIEEPPAWLPPLDGIFTAEAGYIGGPIAEFGAAPIAPPIQPRYTDRMPTDSPIRSISASEQIQLSPSVSTKTHKAWGVDIAKPPVQLTLPPSMVKQDPANGSESLTPVVVGPDGPFPPGMSLARVAQAAHSVIRLEVLHRSASLALWKGPPKWLPFCACGLLSGAYSFLLLSLAVQASAFSDTEPQPSTEELDAMLTNVRVILSGLEAYGTMWDGIDAMAGEVRAALSAAQSLPGDIRNSPQTSVITTL